MTNEVQEEAVEHGVEDGFYSNLPGPRQSAILVCMCGFQATAWTPSWEHAGQAMDEHLEEVRDAA